MKIAAMHRQIWTQAGLATLRRPMRSLLTALGVALGVAVFVATIGMAATLNSVVNATFDQLQATRVTVSDTRTIYDEPLTDVDAIDAQLDALGGVESGGLLGEAGAVQAAANDAEASRGTIVMAVTPGGLQASGSRFAFGRPYDEATAVTTEPVAVLGARVAATLNITQLAPGQAVIVNGVRVSVAGVLADHGSEPQLNNAIIMDPRQLDLIAVPQPLEQKILVRVELGAAASVAQAVPYAIRAHDPTAVGVSFPPEPGGIREGVQESLNTMTYGGAGVAIVIGGVGIMNAMITSVNERTSEIGLRRALGARRGHIVEHILIEGCLIGLLGALLGLLLGVGTLIGVSWFNNWTPVLPSWVWAAPSLGGLAIGALAGLYPALRSARLSPAAALRA
ncbi:ABC transporter permease [Ruania alba]|nr:ABC transporter permease [Ruania alba]